MEEATDAEAEDGAWEDEEHEDACPSQPSESAHEEREAPGDESEDGAAAAEESEDQTLDGTDDGAEDDEEDGEGVAALWNDGELAGALAQGAERTALLKSSLREVGDMLRQLRGNAATVAKQERLLREQQELMKELRSENQSLQDHNEILRADQQQLRRLREESVRQRAEAAEAEERHRRQIAEQQQLVAGVRRDLMALGAENAELRRAVGDVRRVEEQMLQVREGARADEDQHNREVASLREQLGELAHERDEALRRADERRKRDLQEQRFKLLHQRAEREEAAGREIQSLRSEVEQSVSAVSRSNQEQEHLRERLKHAERQLNEALKEAAEAEDRMRQHSAVPAKHVAQIEAQSDDLRRRNRELQAEVEGLAERLAASDATDKAELRARITLMEREMREATTAAAAAKMAARSRSPDDLLPIEHYKREAEAAADRAAELAARLSRVEASLQAKDELLRTRTAERDRLRADQRGSVPRSIRSVADSPMQLSPQRGRDWAPAPPQAPWRVWASPPRGADEQRAIEEELRAELVRAEDENAGLRRRCAELEREITHLRRLNTALSESASLPHGESKVVGALTGELEELRRERDDTVRRLEAELGTLQRRLSGVEQSARTQVDRAMRDRQQLQQRMDELLRRLEDQA